jgi:hypothetical protein
MLFMLVTNVGLKQMARMGGLYVACSLPLLVYLASGAGMLDPPPPDGIHPDWIYTYFRSPGHTAIFVSMPYFIETHLIGVLEAGVWLLICLACFSALDIPVVRRVAILNAVLLSLTLLFVLAAAFDRVGVLIKFYPFRQNALSVLLGVLCVLPFLEALGWSKPQRERAQFILLLLFLPAVFMPVYRTATAWTGRLRGESADSRMSGLAAYIRANTDPEDVFILLHFPLWDKELAFNRVTERERFANYKFVPTTRGKLHEWYQRIQGQVRANRDAGHIFDLRQDYRIDFVVSAKSISDPRLSLRYRDDHYRLYAIQPSDRDPPASPPPPADTHHGDQHPHD